MDAPNNKNESPLFGAIWNNNLAEIKILVGKLKASVNIDNGFENRFVTPLQMACFGGLWKTVVYFIEQKALVNIIDFDGNTALHRTVACADRSWLGWYDKSKKNEYAKIVISLLKADADPKAINVRGHTPGKIARILNNRTLAKLLGSRVGKLPNATEFKLTESELVAGYSAPAPS